MPHATKLAELDERGRYVINIYIYIYIMLLLCTDLFTAFHVMGFLINIYIYIYIYIYNIMLLLYTDLFTAFHVMGFCLPSTSSSANLVALGMWATDT